MRIFHLLSSVFLFLLLVAPGEIPIGSCSLSCGTLSICHGESSGSASFRDKGDSLPNATHGLKGKPCYSPRYKVDPGKENNKQLPRENLSLGKDSHSKVFSVP